MVAPNFLQILIPTCEHVQPHGFVGFPIGFENAGDKWILKPAINKQMQIAMFFVGNLNRCATQFIPGAGDDVLQFVFILLSELLDCLIPICRFNVITQLGIFAEVIVIERQCVAKTLTDGRRERKSAATRPAAPGLDFYKPKRSRHFKLFTQRRNTHA